MDGNSFRDLQGDLATFYNNHGVQLLGMEFPPNVELLASLHKKLTEQIYDGGEYFQIMDDEGQESFVVLAKKPLKAYSNIFVVDHALSFRYNEMHEAIKPEQVERFKTMLKYWQTKKPLLKQDKIYWRTEDFDEMKLKSLVDLKVNEDTQAITFFKNEISSVDEIATFLNAHPNLKAVWFNGNPIDEEELWEKVSLSCPTVELVDGRLTRNAGEWALKYVTLDMDVQKACNTSAASLNFINLSGRDALAITLDLPTLFPNCTSLEIKETEVKDLEQTNRLFRLLKNIETLWCDLKLEEILYDLKDKLSEFTKLQLVNGRSIRSDSKPSQLVDDIQLIKKNLFKIAGTYRLLSTDQMDESSVWYLMDELGSAIQHSDTPNVKVVPFLYLPNGKIDDSAVAFSLIIPIKDIQLGDPIYRDYLMGFDEAKFRSYRLSVWFDIPFDFMIKGYHEYLKNLRNIKLQQIEDDPNAEILYLPKENIKVLTDLEMVTKNLTLPYVSFTLDLEEANLVFFSTGIHDEINTYLGKFINQFPHEYAIISKEKLAYTIQSTFGEVPWLQETFNLQTQLPLFMGAYKEREIQRLNNIWIIKPPNMARSMDMVVTDNLDAIIRLLETGPKLAQKYIERPLTLRGRKFDLRFIVALKSIQPLKVYLYRTFWIRISNNEYTLDVNSFTNYETHFTVMNYGRKLTQIYMHEFVEEFNKEQHPFTWDQQYERIKRMVKDLFVALKLHKPEMGECKKTRAIYGMDLMIDKTYQPKLLEMTFSPDCTRACKYTPSFYNDLFETLFFGVPNENMIPIV